MARIPNPNTGITRMVKAIIPTAQTVQRKFIMAIIPNGPSATAPQITPELTLYTTAQGAGQFKPKLTLSAGAPTPHWDFGDGTVFDGAIVDHEYTIAGTKTVTITPFELVNYIVGLDFRNCNLTGNIGQSFLQYIPNVSGNLYLNNNTNMIVDIRNIPGGGARYYFYSTQTTGDIANLPVGGDIYRFGHTQVSGNISTLPAGGTTYYFYSTNVAAGSVAHLTSAHRLQLISNNWSQSDVDTVISSIYNNRMSFVDPAPILGIGGNNAAPSGIYQYSPTPTTGKEMIYALVNDPDNEGFNKWTITYTT